MPFHFRCQEVCKNIVMQVWPLDNGDQLPMPSPKVLPKKSQRPRVRMRRRHSGPRAEPAAAELALSTIAEESSQHHSTSSVSVDIEPETFVEESAMSTSPPPYTGVTQSAPAVTVASPACCVCHAARVWTRVFLHRSGKIPRDYCRTGNSTCGNPTGAGMHNFLRWRSL